MVIFLILALLLAIVAVIFAVQNVAMVTITMFAWKLDTSLAVALLVALAAGALIAVLLSAPGWVKGKWGRASLRKKLSTAEAEAVKLKEQAAALVVERDGFKAKVDESKLDVARLEEQIASVTAALEKAQNPPLLTPSPSAPAAPATSVVPEDDGSKG